jgi:formamidopyrimidine-DNA glycosylase
MTETGIVSLFKVMPELPEVENIVRSLQVLRGECIQAVQVYSNKVLETPARFFQENLRGKQLIDVTRRAKYLILHVKAGWKLIIHLGMTGQVFIRYFSSSDNRSWEMRPGKTLDLEALPDQHTHVALHLDKAVLFYRDIRKFGFLNLVCLQESENMEQYFGHLGCDPFESDKETVISLLKRQGAMIKPLLLNQRVIAGLGNIYVDETLFKAGIHPKRRASRLSRNRLAFLWDAVQHILKEAIQRGGSSVDDYRLPDGSKGSFQNLHQVYGKCGQPCPRCGTVIKKIRVGGRGTSFCPYCQK